MKTMTTETINSYRNNCVLVAIKTVTDLPDADIFAAVRKHGYKNHHGMYPSDYTKALIDLGLQLGELKYAERIEKPTMSTIQSDGGFQHSYSFTRKVGESLADIVRKLKKGTWLVTTHAHILVVRDGILIDKNWRTRSSLKRKVVSYREVLNPHVPQVRGYVRVVRAYVGSYAVKRYKRVMSAHQFLSHNPQTTKKELLANTLYTSADFAWDLQRGNIEII